jgi:hydroxypyruvate isomerase
LLPPILNRAHTLSFFLEETSMQRDTLWDRRSALRALGAGACVATVPALAQEPKAPGKARGNIKQSICRWCYGRIPLVKLAGEARKLGYQSIELLSPKEYLEIKPLGLTCAVIGGASIVNGLNRKENHAKIEKELRERSDVAATEKLPNVICMSGNRKGMADDEGLKNCAVGLKRVLKFAEEKKVTLIMEGLNSKVNHADYMYDRTKWGVDLCKLVGSARFKLLYDIYHMQIMEGDIIRTITDNKDYIAHYHTGGNPGRNEIDETQELNYPAIVRAIVATGYKGFLGQEFIPKREPFASLAQAFRICDV